MAPPDRSRDPRQPEPVCQPHDTIAEQIAGLRPAPAGDLPVTPPATRPDRRPQGLHRVVVGHDQEAAAEVETRPLAPPPDPPLPPTRHRHEHDGDPPAVLVGDQRFPLPPALQRRSRLDQPSSARRVGMYSSSSRGTNQSLTSAAGSKPSSARPARAAVAAAGMSTRATAHPGSSTTAHIPAEPSTNPNPHVTGRRFASSSSCSATPLIVRAPRRSEIRATSANDNRRNIASHHPASVPAGSPEPDPAGAIGADWHRHRARVTRDGIGETYPHQQ